jgi:hypothetical protein
MSPDVAGVRMPRYFSGYLKILPEIGVHNVD